MCDQVEGQCRIRPAHPAIVRFPIERYPGVLEELRSTVALYLCHERVGGYVTPDAARS